MSKDPAVLLYTSDFLSGCQDLTMIERGQFITLLCLQHQKGYLTNKMIMLTCSDVSEDVLERFDKDEKGNYFNKRMDTEIKKRKSNSEKQSKRAKDYWAKVKQKKEETTSIDNTTAYATALPLENENENENENINKKENTIIVYPFSDESFVKAWDLWKQYKKDIKKSYKSKLSEQAALKNIGKMADDFNDAIEIIEHTISRGWIGLRKEDKTNNYGRKNNSNTTEWSDDFKKEIDGYLQPE
tara:strand:+ start:1688 stop:2413 length:726 start_codon:yes stop_codon:yes gene_type:complete